MSTVELRGERLDERDEASAGEPRDERDGEEPDAGPLPPGDDGGPRRPPPG